MANQKQIDILKEGVDSWNRWRSVELLKKDPAAWNRSRTERFVRIDLSLAELKDAKLASADLTLANLSGADLRGADLSFADLRGADLRLADLRASSLRNSDLQEADLSRSHLSRADVTGAIMRSTVIGDVDLSDIKGLETVVHRGPSTIGVDTVYRSSGKIPESFLRSAGLPDAFVVNVKPLVAAVKPFEMYSCFISYSSKDQDFAERLHADLQSRGVRSWFAPEDLKIGDKLRLRIDEAIKMYDKLLLVLSRHSISSQWVEFEVETALERERRQARAVLFPIRLDEAVMNTNEPWVSHIKNTRHIGDFRRWTTHEQYMTAFNRLFRDLKADKTAIYPMPSGPALKATIKQKGDVTKRVKDPRRDP